MGPPAHPTNLGKKIRRIALLYIGMDAWIWSDHHCNYRSKRLQMDVTKPTPPINFSTNRVMYSLVMNMHFSIFMRQPHDAIGLKNVGGVAK